MAPRDPLIEHMLRRAGFGAAPADVQAYTDMGYATALDAVINYESIFDDADTKIGKPGYVLVTARAGFAPNTNITDARQRWLFRMVHTARPLQEKMALFWHNHFATAFSKISGAVGATEATRVLAAKPSEDAAGAKGQLELFREFATGNFRDLLIAVAQDPAMLIWLDGRTNVKAKPQENFARELMELFTMGVGTFPETDVYAGARVFTGWNLVRVGGNGAAGRFAFNYNANQHDTGAKDFSFPIYRNGSRTIPSRAASAGMQDGIDLIQAVASHPATGPRLARKLYDYFVNEIDPPDEGLIADLARIYYAGNFEIKPMLVRLFTSDAFTSSRSLYKRYSWPAEFVARALREVGWAGFSVNDALTPMVTMGQQLFEPPDVAGWDLGQAWFTSGSMLARMNFAAQLATNQKFELRDRAKPFVTSPESLVSWAMDSITVADFPADSYNAIVDYARAGATWTGSDTQIATKASGIAHLIVGSAQYQFV